MHCDKYEKLGYGPDIITQYSGEEIQWVKEFTRSIKIFKFHPMSIWIRGSEVKVQIRAYTMVIFRQNKLQYNAIPSTLGKESNGRIFREVPVYLNHKSPRGQRVRPLVEVRYFEILRNFRTENIPVYMDHVVVLRCVVRCIPMLPDNSQLLTTLPYGNHLSHCTGGNGCIL